MLVVEIKGFYDLFSSSNFGVLGIFLIIMYWLIFFFWLNFKIIFFLIE